MLRRKINPFIFERTDNRVDYVDKDGTSVYKSSAFLERPSGTAPSRCVFVKSLCYVSDCI